MASLYTDSYNPQITLEHNINDKMNFNSSNDQQQDLIVDHQGDEEMIYEQEIQEYINESKEIYNNLIMFLENSDDSDYYYYFTNLLVIADMQGQEEKREKLEQFLKLISNIAANHHREKTFLKKIFNIIENYRNEIKQTFSNIKIFNIFQSNKLILLYLLENKMITVDDDIFKELLQISEVNGNRYCHFFYTEIKNFADEELKENIENYLLSKDSKIFSCFEMKRHEGENDSYICTLIREDSIEEFVAYVNQSNIPLKSEVKTSIYETNSFLIENKPTLIEYSAFFGSIQIFKYLRLNKVELTPSLWLYAIHSNNAELIHLLESDKVLPPDGKYEKCYREAIKCHHNNIANYIESNLLTEKSNDEEISSNIFNFSNYEFFTLDFCNENSFFYLCFNDYNKLVDLFVEKNKEYFSDECFSLRNSVMKKEADIVALYFLLLKEKKVPDECFENNTELKRVAIPPSITLIGNSAFMGCSSLKQISIPSSVTSIDNRAFSGCLELAQITIPSSVISIGKSAFNECKKITQISIPSSVTEIGESAFNDCSSLRDIILHSPITSIESSLFKGCSSLSQITIPSSVTIIKERAFNGCCLLTRVTIPSSVTMIKEFAFNECRLLKRITIPSSVASIEDGAFCDCALLEKITIPSSVMEIGSSVFSKCSSLLQITIPSSVTKIGEGVFRGCSSLTNITINSSFDAIISSFFFGCKSLTEITIPSSVTSIGYQAFNGCSSLTEILIPPSVTSIKGSAFSGCSSLKKVEIPPSVIEIGDNAFSRCLALKQITIPSSVTSFGHFSFPRGTRIIRK
ncbi:hypothetical protein M9Y10_018792 [Tritrichomonas musculus]|uniref:Surface antigen BspA-like n=1 Tax=Tritrichomonas musculus TaxID=1915356 RepID=A0ABR2HHS8_9EUKA